MFEVTEDWVQAFKSRNGGWNRAQLECIGVQWPPRHGWVKRVVGRQISDEQKRQFESLCGKSLQVLRREKRRRELLPTKPADSTAPRFEKSAPDEPAGLPGTVPQVSQ